jgi:hypothetical protein
LPYWDFTYENEIGVSVFDSIIFTDLYFGTLPTPANGEYWNYDDDSINDGATLISVSSRNPDSKYEM